MASLAASSSSSPESSPEPVKTKASKRKLQRAQEGSAASSSDDNSDSETEQRRPKRESKGSKKKRTAPASDTSDSSADEAEAEDVPALSHAERRKQKKLATLKAAESTSSSKKRKLKDGSVQDASILSGGPTASKPRQNSVWVGNLSFKTTQENLKTFFASAGEVTRINLPTKVASRPNMPLENRGFAYVDFATPEAKLAAIALSEKPLVGRKLLIKDGDDFGGRPLAPGVDIKTSDSALAQRIHSKSAQKILRQQKQPPAPTLFVGNLPFETTEEDLKSLFASHRLPKKKSAKKSDDESDDESSADEGEEVKKTQKEKEEKKKKQTVKNEDKFILKIRMGTFEDTGACKGFTFIDFSSIDNATSALINLKNHHFNGRDLKVEYAGLDAVRRGAAKHLVPAAAAGSSGPKGGKKFTDGGKPSFNARPRVPREPRDAGGEFNMDVDVDAVVEKPHRASRHEEVATAGGGGKGGDDEGLEKAKSASRNARGSGGSGDRPARQPFKKDSRPRARPTPGAALALAKRETAAILPSEGKKITF